MVAVVAAGFHPEIDRTARRAARSLMQSQLFETVDDPEAVESSVILLVEDRPISELQELLTPEQWEKLEALIGVEELIGVGEPQSLAAAATIAADADVQVAAPEVVEPPVSMPSVTTRSEPLPRSELKEPLSVGINGPTDALVGDMVFLSAEVRGDVTSFTWSIDPPSKGLVVRDGGRSAVFSNRTAQPYTVLVSVAGNGGYSAHDFLTFELMERIPDSTVPASAIGMSTPELDANTQVKGWTLEVESASKAADAAIIASAFRSVAVGLRNGQIPTGENPLDQVRVESELGMGPVRFEPWNFERGWFDDCEDFLAKRQANGEVVTNEQFAGAFVNLATLLEEAVAAELGLNR